MGQVIHISEPEWSVGDCLAHAKNMADEDKFDSVIVLMVDRKNGEFTFCKTGLTDWEMVAAIEMFKAAVIQDGME